MNKEFLPDADKATVDREKITEYLLCKSHPDGRAKATFFTKFGFRGERWEVLAEALRKHGMSHPVVKTVESSYGVRYCIDGPIETPDGSNPRIRTVWIAEDEKSAITRLVTAYPI